MKKCPLCKDSQMVRPVPFPSAWGKWLLRPLFLKCFQCAHCGKRFRRVSFNSTGRPMLKLEAEQETFPEFIKKDNKRFEEVLEEMREFEQRRSIRQDDDHPRSVARRSGDNLSVINKRGKTQMGGT